MPIVDWDLVERILRENEKAQPFSPYKAYATITFSESIDLIEQEGKERGYDIKLSGGYLRITRS